MSEKPEDPDRRRFLGDAVTLGASSLMMATGLVTDSIATPPRAIADRGQLPPEMTERLPDLPTHVLIDHDGSGFVEAQRQGSRFT